jgi:hypothetical protein
VCDQTTTATQWPVSIYKNAEARWCVDQTTTAMQWPVSIYKNTEARRSVDQTTTATQWPAKRWDVQMQKDK